MFKNPLIKKVLYYYRKKGSSKKMGGPAGLASDLALSPYGRKFSKKSISF
jgi:hypothetical protein